ncbi:MAG: YihY/virulence factor BrkB family protein [Burkholderiaceae bacterium]|nr:YihY/virulence factor BrkB family protein [Burkholderiaceae bacterium]
MLERVSADAVHAFRIARLALDRFASVNGMRSGAAVAFYAAFSMAPLLVVLTGLLVWLLGDAQAQAALLGSVRHLLGEQEARTLQAMLLERPALTLSLGSGALASWVALATTLLGSTGVFVELRSSLQNMLAEAEPPFGWRYLLQARLIAVGVVLGCGFLLAIAMVLQGLALVGLNGMAARWPLLSPLLAGAELGWSWLVITALFTVMLRWLPDGRLRWRWALGGALLAASLFMLGRWGISLYVAGTASKSALGAASSFAALLVWIYWSSQIFLLGAAWAVALRDSALSGRTAPTPLRAAG